MSECVEPIVGKILAGWRYDISGLAPEMRGDYELHFASCEHCRSRQKVRYFGPRHAFWLEVGALAGFALSALIWLIVAVATPAPMVMVDVAKLGARHVHDRLPAEIRERLPEEIRVKITGS